MTTQPEKFNPEQPGNNTGPEPENKQQSIDQLPTQEQVAIKRTTPESPYSIDMLMTQKQDAQGLSDALKNYDSAKSYETRKGQKKVEHQPVQVTVKPVTRSSPLIKDVIVEGDSKRELTGPLAVPRPRRLPRPSDPGLIVTLLVAYMASLLAFWYFYQTHQLVLYGDAYAHMLIIRRVFDNVTPGLAQLGGVWLPLPHLAMLPFIWNGFLWRTGIAGTIPSMICFMISSAYIYLAARRLTHNSMASFLGTLVFILNPNALYLQTTALTEPVLIATLTAASYYYLAWVQDDKFTYLMLAGLATCLATLSRYDGWFLFVVMLVMIVPIGRLKHQRWSQIEGNMISFASIGGLGIVLWCVWCLIIFGNPLYFQDGPFSSQAQQQSLINSHVLFTYHDILQSIRYYTIDAMQNLGPVLFVLSAISVVIFAVRRRLTPEMLAGLVYLSTFVFYIVSLYTGQAAIYVPGAVPASFQHQIYNARYGVEVVGPAAIFIALLANLVTRRVVRAVWQVVLVAVILAQGVVTALGGIISLQDGQDGLDCAHAHPIIVYLARHYNGGKILEDLYTTKMDELNPDAQINFSNMIYEGSGKLWTQALTNPAATVNWIIVNPGDQNDQVAKNLTPEFNAQFTRVVEEESGLSLYFRDGLVFPTKPIPSYLSDEHSLCVDQSNVQPSVPSQGVADLSTSPVWQRQGASATLGAQFINVGAGA